MFPQSDEAPEPQAPATIDKPEVAGGDVTDVDAPKSITLDPTQLSALCGDDCQPGAEYTIKIRVGDKGEDGSSTAEIVSSEPSPTEEGAETPLPLGDSAGLNDEDDAEETKTLGFSRKKFAKNNKKEVPAIDPKDLEY